jgi:cytochrome c2
MTETAEATATTEITATDESTSTEDEDSEADTEGGNEEATDEEANAEVDPTLVGLPEEMLVAMAKADPERGQQLTLSNACIACHTVDPNVTMVGPTWNNVATTAESRVPDMSSGLYLYNSIIHPNDYVVESYPPGVMLQIYGNLPAQDLADLVSYLLTLKEPS